MANSKACCLLSAALLLLITVGCCNRKATKSVSLEGTKWQVVQLQGEPVQPVAEKFVLNFNDDETISGEGSCNKFFASYKYDNTLSLSFTNMGSTRMACPDMQSEAQFFTALDSTNAFEIEGRKLMLMDGDKVLVILQRAD